MKVCVLYFTLHIPWAKSLKDKRQEISSLIKRVGNKFNCSVIESNYQDVHQKSEIAVCFIAHTNSIIDSTGQNITDFIYSNTEAEITSVEKEER